MDSDYSNKYIILCLLHELRIVSKKQLLALFNVNSKLSSFHLYKHLKELKKETLIDCIFDKTKQGNPVYYFLTKEGHNSIGGYYTLPKVPEYNLNHHLQVNDYIIHMLQLAGNHPHLKLVMSERRQVYETKDCANQRNRKKYFVADFIFRFRTKENHEVNWSFEIELTMKTRRRYREGIFPKYIKELKKREYARLIYVTPSPLIQEELEKFKRYFIKKEGEEYAEIFNRLHIFSEAEFEEQMKRLIEEDPFINWSDSE